MKRFVLLILVSLVVSVSAGLGQDKMTSDSLVAAGKEMDEQIAGLSKKIEDIIKKHDLLNNKKIRILPYQTAYNLGNDFIMIEQHRFVKDEMYNRDITGIKINSMKIFTNGQSISKIESVVYENNHVSEVYDRVVIVDPSPTTSSTDDIKITRTRRGSVILDKNLGEIKNTTAFPVRNEIKRDFLVPHLTDFYNAILFIAESYAKSLKDSDSGMVEFLKQASEK